MTVAVGVAEACAEAIGGKPDQNGSREPYRDPGKIPVPDADANANNVAKITFRRFTVGACSSAFASTRM